MLNNTRCRPVNNKENNEYKTNFTPSVLKNDGTGNCNAGMWMLVDIYR